MSHISGIPESVLDRVLSRVSQQPRIETASARYMNDPIHHRRVEVVRQMLMNVGLTYTSEQISVILNADDMRGLA